MEFQRDALEEALSMLGAVLLERNAPFSLLVIGGSGLLLLRLVDRPTGDVDVIGVSDNGHYVTIASLPAALEDAAVEVAQALELSNRWLTTGPASLMDLGLPRGWEERVSIFQYGALEVHALSRVDQICFKLYAAVDRGPDDKHFNDLRTLEPSEDELRMAAQWAVTHDHSPAFRNELIGCLGVLGVVVSDGDFTE